MTVDPTPGPMEDQERSDEIVRDGLALQAAVAAVREHLKAFGTEPYGDLALNADRAAVIAVAALEAAGWRPQDDEMLAEEFRKGFEAGEVNAALLREGERESAYQSGREAAARDIETADTSGWPGGRGSDVDGCQERAAAIARVGAR